jgi:hypothetical protein
MRAVYPSVMHIPGRFLSLLALIAFAAPLLAEPAPPKKDGDKLKSEAKFMAAFARPPESHVLDQAGVLAAKEVERVSPALMDVAKSTGVNVYLVTTKETPKKDLPSRERIELFANKLLADWVGRGVGALLVYDHETGLVSIATSKATDERFTQQEINLRIGKRLQGDISIVKKQTERENVCVTSLTVADTLRGLQMEWIGKRKRIAFLVVLVLLTIVAVSAFRVSRMKQS